ncbi:MAG: GGDEF domain-containing protein [Bacilli bacterium]|nr:GGDEF domain-containing protein [Bacilli bacterium]
MKKEIESDEKLDIHYIGYRLMIQALRDVNINEGLKKALYLIKIYLKSDDVILFKQDEHGEYIHYSNNALMDDDSKIISIILNKAKSIIEKKEYFNFDINIKSKQNDVLFIPIPFDNSKYVMTINNSSKIIEQNNHAFIKIIKEAMTVILEKYESYERIQKNSTIDNLTGLNNRNSYEEKLKLIDTNQDNLIFGIFDLFGLKYVNDNHGYLAGDKYISDTASILKKYFPEYVIRQDEHGKYEKIYTGTNLYRIGGDEYVLITTTDTLEMVETKTKLAAEEVNMLDLGIEKEFPTGLNYGIVERTKGETTKELNFEADKLLMQDKSRMYKEYGIERRRMERSK